LDQGHHVFIILLNALELQQIVIGTTRAGGILAAHEGTSMIYRAASGLWIQKSAGPAKDGVGLPAQDALFAIHLGKAFGSSFDCQTKMSRQPIEITLGYLDSFID
jgi:hypothetical protein